YGLQQFDTRNASDHFPKVTDYSFLLPTIIDEGEHTPTGFMLEQNYPNPFNPTTKIKFTISKSVILSEAKNLINVQLKVFDTLGSKIATLVNEELPAGNYEFTFDAADLSSGLYFYQLSAGNFVETNKMILLK
ncbi:MAG: T9SS type A sorting domain-containing protein, partial [Bacteroidetes bacterium]|nr:T9SS type A sorting domain-containing protein [Bacteroidota bacterium]